MADIKSGLRTRAENILIDEIEQLRVTLETALEENAILASERDRLRAHLGQVTQELRVTHAAMDRVHTQASEPDARALARFDQNDEELRVAFEELQVLTEELEAANTTLHQTNQDLDARIEQRTRQLQQINAALGAAEASLRAIADLVPDLLWRTDAKGEADWFNERWLAYSGRAGSEAKGAVWFEAIHPDDRMAAKTAWARALASGEPYQHEHRICDVAGESRWFLVRGEPLRDERGRIVRWFVAGTDIHDQRLAMHALQRSELRFRTLIERVPQLIWRAVADGHWTWCSPQWCEYTGQRSDEALGMGWLDMVYVDDRDRLLSAWQNAEERGTLDMEGRIFHAAEKRHRHFQTRALPVRADERIIEWLGTCTDVDDIFQLQGRQSVLVAELQHRTRNLMAVVQATTTRTLREATSLAQFAECFNDRLAALARVQALLSRREGGTRVSFDLLLREEIAAHVPLDEAGNGPQVTLHGPAGVPLRSSSIQTFALALHELATNAVKYGALSQPSGHLQIAWHVEIGEAGDRRLCVDWRESGVADMPARGAQPQGGGYGRELIERALPYQLDARTHYAFAPDGVHCTIEVIVPPDDTNLEMSNG